MKKNINSKTKEMFNKLVDSVENIINNGEYERFLKFSRNFHNYSFNNKVLIFSQNKNATQVAGFKAWQRMGRKLKKGAKGIQIMYPIRRTYTKKINGQSNLFEEDTEETTKKVEYFTYRPTYVFDVSDTIGKPIPLENKKINSNSMRKFFSFLKDFSPYPIIEDDLFGGCNGYWSPKNKQIVLKKWLSINDKTAVLLHELSHALYDNFNYKEDRNLSEIFVESVAYIVADYFGLDTSMCSFNYITAWSKGNIKMVLELGDKIQKAANNFIKELENEFESKNMRISV